MLLVALGTLALGSCATMFQGGPDMIPVTSTPSGATVQVDGMAVGTTPCTVSVRRKARGMITVNLPGHEPVNRQLRTTFNGTFLLDFLWGWIMPIPILVDVFGGNVTRWDDAVFVKFTKAEPRYSRR